MTWDRGAPTFHSADGRYWIKPLAQAIFDLSSTSGGGDPRENITRSGARALHLGLAGGAPSGLAYQVEVELADGDANILWAYIGIRRRIGAADGDVMLGNFQNDRGVEGASGGEALPLIEPNFIATAIAPMRGDFGLGVQARAAGSRWHASIAITGDDIDARRAASDRRVIQARAHWSPQLRAGTALHFGLWGYDEALSGSDRSLTGSATVAHGRNPFAAIPSAALIDARGDQGYGAELGAVAGRFWAMAETARRDIDLPGDRREHQDATSVSAGFFLTSTPAYYNPRSGTFGRPRPARPVLEGGAGAVEITARYQMLDLGTLPGAGSGWSATAGANWYLNDFVRFMINGTRWSRDVATTRDRGTTIAVRAQLAF